MQVTCKEGRCAPPVHMILLTEEPHTAPYVWGRGAAQDQTVVSHWRQRWRTLAPSAPTTRLRRGIPAEAIGQKPEPRSGGSDVAVTQVRGLLGGELILALQGAQPVLGKGRHPGIVGGLEIDPVHAGRVAAEDQLLDRAVGATERSKTIFLLHILRDFESTQRLDLPLGRPVPNRVGAPKDMIDPHALDQRADQSSAEFGVRHGRVGKRRTKLCVNVSEPELLWNFREISGPPDAACGLELGPGLVG